MQLFHRPNSLSDLLHDRPLNADPVIRDDLPNEYGTPNHYPDGSTEVENRHVLTGSGSDGTLYSQSASQTDDTYWCFDEPWSVEKATCWDWTSNEAQGCLGNAWPSPMDGVNWLSVLNEGGCLPGGNLVPTGGYDGTRRVGSTGG